MTAGLILAGAPAAAQDAIQQVPTPWQGGLTVYAPFVWNGNALDQKILDAQAQILPPRRLVIPRRHPHHRG